MRPPREVIDYYERFPEESRLESGASRLEFERTIDILERVLPPPPARVVDVGGAAGIYSFWLAQRGYETHLVDASSRLIREAETRNARDGFPLASVAVADARSLPQPAGFAAAVLLMGPLYHLQSDADRATALSESFRILQSAGVAAVAGISRYASALDGLARRRAADPAFIRMRDRDLHDGHHINATDRLDYFTTAYFHRPDDLRSELQRAGFDDVVVLGVEGPGWILPDLQERWNDPVLRKDVLDVARALEGEAAIAGASAHLLGIGRKR